MKKVAIICILAILVGSCRKDDAGSTSEVKAPPASLGLNSFYKKYLDASGIPIVSSENVADEALLNARNIVNNMVSSIPVEKAKMIENRLRVGIIGINERPTQMPEYSDLYTAFPGTDWDNRARAYGATLARPLTTNCEENMRCLGSVDRYQGEEILTHEFAHAIHELGARFTDPGFDTALQAAYDHAIATGLWTNTYCISEVREYWAEGVQCWFNCNKEANPANGVHNEINTRSELQTYDSMLYELIRGFFSPAAQKHGCY